MNPRPPESQSGALPTELRPPTNSSLLIVTAAYHDYDMVRPAGLEPATLGLEGRCSIRLSYGRGTVPLLLLSTNLLTLSANCLYLLPFLDSDKTDKDQNMVGVERFELPTSCTQSRRATRLRYTPFSLQLGSAL